VRPHATRTRYQGGCRCIECRVANARYQSERKERIAEGGGNPTLADTTHVREHILALRRAGVGRRAIQAAADVSVHTCLRIMAGGRCRRRTAERILALDAGAVSGGVVLSYRESRRTHRLLAALHAEGYTKKQIASLVAGAPRRALQIGTKGVGGRVTVATAARVQRVYARFVEVPA
jgi:hypothetical protein